MHQYNNKHYGRLKEQQHNNLLIGDNKYTVEMVKNQDSTQRLEGSIQRSAGADSEFRRGG